MLDSWRTSFLTDGNLANICFIFGRFTFSLMLINKVHSEVHYATIMQGNSIYTSKTLIFLHVQKKRPKTLYSRIQTILCHDLTIKKTIVWLILQFGSWKLHLVKCNNTKRIIRRRKHRTPIIGRITHH